MDSKDVIADKLMTANVKIVNSQTVRLKSQKNTRSLSKNLSAGNFSFEHDHAPVMFFMTRALSLCYVSRSIFKAHPQQAFTYMWKVPNEAS